ncbi:MAG TPA: YdcF family protein [Deltaproteobacteria bacterium]|jgi:hypothetical protein|nr:YdcF family protein [Pseudomonadota bacterium]NLW66840.1 YdcF family protein [Bacteriovoracaceae bacterium]HNR50221.1 YdcF family protein [Deltaproteobacteria bacterium]HRR70112.1 YdcF family protein [Desulfomonilia bacterium]HOD72664.1 YdcF family protein [Deltaproteobacteria bacterium]
MKRRRAVIIAVSFLCLAALATLLVRIEMQQDDAGAGSKVDAVIVLAGPPDEDRQRIVEGVHLIERGSGDYLILAMRDTGLSWKTILRIYGIDTGIPGERVLIGRPERVNSTVLKYCGGTFGEAAAAVGLMQAHSLDSAVVVSSRYHIPRVRLAFGNLNSKGSLVFFYRPVGEPETGKLLSSAHALAKRLIEYGKFFTAFFVYPVGAKIIENDPPCAEAAETAPGKLLHSKTALVIPS